MVDQYRYIRTPAEVYWGTSELRKACLTMSINYTISIHLNSDQKWS